MFRDYRTRLRRRSGGSSLAHLEVYYDFEWDEVFEHGRTCFRGGLSLAQTVRRDCPDGKTPVLVLTRRTDVSQDAFEDELSYVVVIPVLDYLRDDTSSRAMSYFARTTRMRVTQLVRFQELDQEPALVAALLERYTSLASVVQWAKKHEEHLHQLRAFVAEVDEEAPPATTPADLAAAVRALDGLDPDLLDALAVLLAKGIDREVKRVLLDTMLADPEGRAEASAVMGLKVAERVLDARRAAAVYEKWLEDPEKGETELQAFLRDHPWLIHLEYTRIKPEVQFLRGRFDFILERYDGCYDILELKDPQDAVILIDGNYDEVQPAACRHSLSPALSQALAQVHVYRDQLAGLDEDYARRVYGLRFTRIPRMLIVIGRWAQMNEYQRRVLSQLNMSLHNTEIIPYDVLTHRARGFLSNVERYLQISGAPPALADEAEPPAEPQPARSDPARHTALS